MYIRTKDGVYEVKVNKYHELVYCKDNQLVLSCNIINQSENLEELCDQIVYNGYLYQVTLLNNCLIEDSFEELREPITDEMIKEGIYGAIWTDKGLIYVAKMDSEGKLVLV